MGDTRQVTGDMWHTVGGENSLKISAPQLLWFGIQCLEDFELKDHLMK